MKTEYQIVYVPRRRLLWSIPLLILMGLAIPILGMFIGDALRLRGDFIRYMPLLIAPLVIACAMALLASHRMKITILSEACFEIEVKGSRLFIFREEIEALNYYCRRRKPPVLEIQLKDGRRKRFLGGNSEPRGSDPMREFFVQIRERWQLNGAEITI